MLTIDLSGKRALVSGGASGIGRACCLLLHQAGAQVAVMDLNEAGANETVALMGGGSAIRCDLGNPDDVVRGARAAEEALGQVDYLINCAGIIAYRTGLEAVTPDQWDLVLDVNLRGTFLLCRELIGGMQARRYGRIVTFSSLAARVGGIEAGAHYAASKAGLIGLTRTMAKIGGAYNVTANAVAPGVIATDPVRAQVGDHVDAYTSTIPLQRLGEPIDVANVVLFLVSPLADYLTGLVIDVNGGMYMG
ncbi:MAG: SDR family oxidoreductase [Chloroflexi bacterium]|nr:SDR family oxidoreductase [Chloroflexota bacterium]